ncbi:DUF6522 family protein [Albimonas sp. CAU 1670]|uniref:DUF6522 family protein n=1 Tax=Albimonas sp. CAU 1670 TaxID=3032599 RepID=UPI0023DBE0D8|nr:DUF6522 family protein [Albimonas sp. CAU 1670]MDF2233190.1 DUF6522 family protein [Albimonas sp. CAU 1670]
MTVTPERLERREGGFVIEAERLAALLGLPAEQVRAELNAGRIVTRVEKGEGEDAGTWRLTFLRGADRARLVVDAQGRELRRSRISVPPPPKGARGSPPRSYPTPLTAAPPPAWPPAPSRLADEDRPDEATLRALVDDFYAQVRADPELGPLFNAAVADWPAHLERIAAFWSSALLGSGAYKGDPFGRHRPHAPQMTAAMFERWLALWAEATEAHLSPAAARSALSKARRIASGLRMALLPQVAGDGFRLPS